ncbi:MAG: hypothetical protein WCV84_05040 [Patescibacteria group bacterium]
MQKHLLFDRVLPLIQETVSARGLSAPPLLVAVAGGSCSGKTTLAKHLTRALTSGGSSTALLCEDWYFKDHDDPTVPSLGAYPWFDHPAAFHVDAFLRAVDRLRAGGSCERPVYNLHENRRTAERVTVLPGRVVLAEGLYVMDALKRYARGSLFLFVDAEDDVRLECRVQRDAASYGFLRTSVEAYWTRFVLPAHREYVLRQKRLATYVVQNNVAREMRD